MNKLILYYMEGYCPHTCFPILFSSNKDVAQHSKQAFYVNEVVCVNNLMGEYSWEIPPSFEFPFSSSFLLFVK